MQCNYYLAEKIYTTILNSSMKCDICLEEKDELMKMCQKHKYCECCYEVSKLYTKNYNQCFLCMNYWINTMKK